MRRLVWINLLIVVTFMSCGSDDANEQSQEEINAIKLSGSWKMGSGSSVTREGVDITEEYSNLLIRFTTSNQYTVQGDPNNVFFPSGTWKFVEGDIARILLNSSDVPINLSYQDDDHLTLTFTVVGDQPLGGRVNGISGQYQFALSR